MNLLHAILSAILFISLMSCKVQKKQENELNYLQNIDQITTSLASKSNILQPGDELIIDVSANDMSVVAPFNKNYRSTGIIQTGEVNGNVLAQGQTTLSGPTYIIGSNGSISYPLLGDIQAAGKTIAELKQELKTGIEKYVLNPTVNIRISNFKVTVLGEVKRQGEYIISDGHGTFFDALGKAGDLTIYGDRTNILMVRNTNGVISKKVINLQDVSFINSPFFNLRQGDVIYVPANKTQEKISKLNPNTPLYISAAGIVVTVLALIFKK